jgi:exosortase
MDQSIAHTRALEWHAGALPMMLLTALVVVLYWPSATALHEVWWHSDRGVYSQGYLIAAACVWILAMRAREAGASLRPNPWAAPLVLVLGFLWLIGARSGIQTAEALLLPFVLWAAILAMFGPSIARACLFPCALLLLAIPIWDPLSASLQSITAQVAALILRALQVPIRVAGNVIAVRGVGSFEVASSCSGLGMLLVGLSTAALYGEMQRQPWPRRLALLALAAALSIVANWVRVAGIILLAYYTSFHNPLVKDHYFFGWGVFALMLLGFFPLARRIAGAPPLEPPPAPPNSMPAKRALPDAKAATALVFGALALGPVWNWVAAARTPPSVSAQLPADPPAGWVGPTSAAPDDWAPQVPGADAARIGVYKRGPQQVTAFTAAFAVQRHGKKLAGYGVEILAPDEDAVSQRRIAVGPATLSEIEAAGPHGSGALVWLRYTVGERHFTSAWRAQLAYGWASLSSPPASHIMLLRAPCAGAGDCSAARAALTQFVSDTGALEGG